MYSSPRRQISCAAFCRLILNAILGFGFKLIKEEKTIFSQTGDTGLHLILLFHSSDYQPINILLKHYFLFPSWLPSFPIFLNRFLFPFLFLKISIISNIILLKFSIYAFPTPSNHALHFAFFFFFPYEQYSVGIPQSISGVTYQKIINYFHSILFNRA